MKKSHVIERPHTAIIYVRVSSDEQVRGYSLQTQEKVDREYCAKNEWQMLKVFREEGESAKSVDRTQLNLMKEYCLKNIGKVGYIVVWKLDRFARNQYDHFELRAFFSRLGVELRSATEVIENTSTGRAVEGMLAVMAQMENDIKTDRTIAGMRAKALDGYWPVGAPWGHKNAWDDVLKKKIIVLDKERAPIVKLLFEEYSRGTVSFAALADKVNEMGDIRSKHGRKMSKQLVYKILKNPIHSGWIEIPKFDISVQGRHEAIVSRELYDEVQSITLGGKARKQSRHQDNPDFPLRGVKCEHCGGNRTGGWTKGKMKKQYAYYNCHNPKCPGRMIRKLDLEQDFTDFLIEKTPDASILNALGEALAVVHEKVAKDGEREASRIETRLEKLQRDLDELLKVRVSGLIDNEQFSRQSDKWKVEIRELEIRRTSLMNPNVALASAVKFGINLIKELPTCWPMLEPGELKVLIQLLFPQNIIYQYPGFKTLELSPIYAVESGETDDPNRFVTPTGIGPVFSP